MSHTLCIAISGKIKVRLVTMPLASHDWNGLTLHGDSTCRDPWDQVKLHIESPDQRLCSDQLLWALWFCDHLWPNCLAQIHDESTFARRTVDFNVSTSLRRKAVRLHREREACKKLTTNITHEQKSDFHLGVSCTSVWANFYLFQVRALHHRNGPYLQNRIFPSAEGTGGTKGGLSNTLLSLFLLGDNWGWGIFKKYI